MSRTKSSKPKKPYDANGQGFDNSYCLYTTATGCHLNQIGFCFGVKRNKDELDSNYRLRIEEAIKEYNRK